MQRVTDSLPGYTYGTKEVAASTFTLADLHSLMASVGFTAEDERQLRLAGAVLEGQTKAIVDHWRGVIVASNPNLIRHSRSLEGQTLPEYTTKSGLRFEQWILDTCFRAYDQDWLNYQEEIALRHTSLKKNAVDGVVSTPYVPLRDILGFIAVMNDTIKPYLGARGNSAGEVDAMHRAWCKSLQLQAALWTKPYADPANGLNEW